MTTTPRKGGRPHFDPANPLTERMILHLSKRDMAWLRRRAGGAKLGTFVRKVLRHGMAWMERL